MEEFRLGLTGYPIDHSLSPLLHRAALVDAGLPGMYSLFPIPPGPGSLEALEGLLTRVRSGEITGFNITIPHKQAVLPLLDRLTGTARAIGAVNTIYLRDGLLTGDNTDAAGFLADLDRWAPGEFTQPVTVLVLGAGGAARAVAFSLAQRGSTILVASRDPAQGKLLCDRQRRFFEDDPGGPNPRLVSLPLETGPLSRWLEEYRPALIVNATPLGSAHHPDVDPLPGELVQEPPARVLDLVYNPPQTPLLQRAARLGLPWRNGLGMLVEQAALAFETWTAVSPNRQAMLAALENDRSR